MWKVYNDEEDNDDGQRTNFDQKSSIETLAQVSWKFFEPMIIATTQKQFSKHGDYGLLCARYLNDGSRFFSVGIFWFNSAEQ